MREIYPGLSEVAALKFETSEALLNEGQSEVMVDDDDDDDLKFDD